MFAGAGISDVGFERAGFECLAQVEIDKNANNVRKKHFPSAQHFEDIRSFDAKQFRGVDAVFGGFPCQDYSVAGKRVGIRGDRGALWWEFHRVISESGAGFIGLENVPGLLSSGSGIDFRDIVDSLVELGYSVAWRVLNLRYFGVPQRRRRVLIVGSLGGRCAGQIQLEPESLCGDFEEGSEAWEEDTRDVAGCLRGGSGTRGHNTSLDCCGAFIPSVSLSLMDKAMDSQDPTMQTYLATGTLSANMGGSSHANELEFCIPFDTTQLTSKTNRSNPASGDPCHTISRCADAPSIAFAHQAGIDIQASDSDSASLKAQCSGAVQSGWRVRRLTPRECERLMGLPDDYTRWGADGKELSDGPRYKMIGNGWSVPQAEWLARRIAAQVQ